MPKRGVVYVVWGEAIEPLLQRSIDSLARHHPDLPIHVARLPNGSKLLAKAEMFGLSPFEETLFLDADTIVLDSLDFGFEKAKQFGLACCICESPYARRYEDERLIGDVVEYNTGVIFFTRAVAPLFAAWRRWAGETDSRMISHDPSGERLVQVDADQPSFAAAVESEGFCPYVLPMNWNYRPYYQTSVFGLIKIWHDRRAPTAPFLEWNDVQRRDRRQVRLLRIKQ